MANGQSQQTNNHPPVIVADEEKLVRFVFYPQLISENNILRYNIYHFRVHPCENDISVTRYDYAGLTFCRRMAKSIGNAKRDYRGLACLTAQIPRETKLADVIANPSMSNKYHAGIVRTYQQAESAGTVNDAQWNYVADHLLKATVFYRDPDPEALWTSGEI